MVPSQRAVQVRGYKGFDAQRLQITGILVLTQELSSEDIETSHKGQAGRGDLCTGLTPLLNDRNQPQLIYMHASLLIRAKHFRAFELRRLQ